MASIQFSYTLTEEEIYRGLRLSGIYKLTGKRALIESILLVVFFLFFFISFLIDQGTFDLVMSLVCAVLLAVMNPSSTHGHEAPGQKGNSGREASHLSEQVLHRHQDRFSGSGPGRLGGDKNGGPAEGWPAAHRGSSRGRAVDPAPAGHPPRRFGARFSAFCCKAGRPAPDRQRRQAISLAPRGRKGSKYSWIKIISPFQSSLLAA